MRKLELPSYIFLVDGDGSKMKKSGLMYNNLARNLIDQFLMICHRESKVTDAFSFPTQVRCQGAMKRGSAQSNRSKCCSFGIHNSSHFHNPCTPAEEGSSSAQHNPLPEGPMTSQCVLRIPITLRRKRPLVSYDLVSCEGVTVRLVCETSCSDQGVSWRKEGRSLTEEKELRLQDIRREDGGIYFCEVTDYYGRSRLAAQVIVTVQCCIHIMDLRLNWEELILASTWQPLRMGVPSIICPIN
ncbi:hypothetical protein CEXT_177021 [Caerostris extrusa]|uniref:Ig-like domain-containing protein n=1 Tax=Caerostris extrusa TaxID=172846 RepID=A0AAV4N8K0_CAEEX|nr:hypothetical protein CEXT_177021 [Caerostris extrusa]